MQRRVQGAAVRQEERGRPRRRLGMATAEALMAMTIASLSATAMLTSLQAAVSASADAVATTKAYGLAKQLMDEVSAVRFPAQTNIPLPSGAVRAQFDDIDDFSSYRHSPPVDRMGFTIGTEGATGSAAPRSTALQPDSQFLSNLIQEVDVERVTPSGTNNWDVVATHTPYRRVTVRIQQQLDNSEPRTLAVIVRIFAYAPPGS